VARQFKHAALRIEAFAPRLMKLVREGPIFWKYIRLRWLIQRKRIRWRNVELLFVHIPKTGGTSVHRALKEHGLIRLTSLDQIKRAVTTVPSDTIKLLTLDHLDPMILVSLGLVPRRQFASLTAFCVMRNPYSRAWSAYRHYKPAIVSALLGKGYSFDNFIDLLCRKSYRPRLVAQLGLSHGSPQYFWIDRLPKQTNLQIFRLEEISALEEFLSKRIGAKVTIQHQNAARRKDPAPKDFPFKSDFEKRYLRDFQLGNYPIEFQVVPGRRDH
jgi:hypothetical protein